MHELSIAQALIGQIRQVMREQGVSRVLRVGVRIGVLSGVERHALALAFPIAAESAGLGSVDLDVEMVPSRVACRKCGNIFSPRDMFFLCDKCESADVEITEGRELCICSMQVEKS